MKKEVSRERRLGAFSLTLDDLDLLCARMLELFGGDKRVHISIEIDLEGATIMFDNVAELREYTGLRGRVTNFSLRASSGESRVALRSHSLASPRALASATGGSEAWCAGAIETVGSFVSEHRVWYHGFVAVPWNGLAMALVVAGGLLAGFVPANAAAFGPVVLSWGAATASLLLISGFRNRLLPAATIVVTENEGFVKRHAGELSLVLTICAVLIALAAWLFPISGR